jgi:MoaA/NifB/PqqE/SkfB family radical SAM enzyme
MAGGDRESYRAVQGCDDFDLVVRNLGRMARRKRALGLATELGVAMLVNRSNAHTLPGLAKTLGEVGIDYLQVRQDMYSAEADVRWWRDEVAPVALELAAGGPRTGLRILGARYVDAQTDLTYPTKCHAHHFVLAINAEGFVCFCKNTRDKPDFYVGNLHDKTFSEIWRSSLRLFELEGSICPSNCATFCKNMDINTAVESVARGEASPLPESAPRPVHLNFL